MNKKGIAPHAGVSKEEAKNLSVTSRLDKKLHDKIMKSVNENKVSISEQVRNIIEFYYNKSNQNGMKSI